MSALPGLSTTRSHRLLLGIVDGVVLLGVFVVALD